MSESQEVDDLDRVTEAVLAASRALIAVASRSIASVDDDVTLPQFRALVVLSQEGPRTVGQLARELRVQPSTATRLCDRLARKRLIRRRTDPDNRREVVISLSPGGDALVTKVTALRRREIGDVMAKVPARQRAAIVAALESFSLASGIDSMAIAW